MRRVEAAVLQRDVQERVCCMRWRYDAAAVDFTAFPSRQRRTSCYALSAMPLSGAGDADVTFTYRYLMPCLRAMSVTMLTLLTLKRMSLTL